MRRRTLGLVVALAAVAAAAVVLWPKGGDGPRATEVAGGGAATEGVPAGAPADAASERTGPGLAAGRGPARAAAKDDAAFQGRSTIFGTVRRDGKPCAAKVSLFLGGVQTWEKWQPEEEASPLADDLDPPPPPDPPSATAEAGDDGKYAFEGWGAGSYQVVARAEGVAGFAEPEVRADGERVRADVALGARDQTLRGRVVSAGGKRWLGFVTAYPAGLGSGDAGRTFGVTTTPGEDGHFALSGLVRGRTTVAAVEPGARRVEVDVTLPSPTEAVLDVDAAAVAITGRVVADADGKPVAGAEVCARGWGADTDTEAAARTDADGKFAVSLAHGREAWLQAQAPGFVRESANLEEGKTDVELRLKRPARLEGRVLGGPEAKPIEGARVEARVARDDGGAAEIQRATTGADGRYAVPLLRPGRLRVTAFARGWVTKANASRADAPSDATAAPGATVVVDVAMVEAARIQGKVVDPAGAPVAGAVVTAVPADTDERERYSYDSARLPVDGVRRTPVLSGTDGAFVLDDVRADCDYAVRADAISWRRGEVKPVHAGREGTASALVRLGVARSLDVLVVEEGTNAPIADATIRGADSRECRRTDADGHARIEDASPGPWTLVASADDHVDSESIAVPADATTLTVTLRRGLEIAGHVRRPDGSPVESAGVNVNGKDDTPGYGWAESGADGAFRVRGLAPGDYVLTASETVNGVPHSAKATAKAGREDVVLTLEPSGGLVVRVLDGDGKPVPRATADFDQSGHGFSGWYVYRGSVTFEGIAAGAAGTLKIRSARDAAGAPLPWAPVEVEGVVPSETPVEVRLRPALPLSGDVRAGDGKGVEGVTVFAIPGEDRYEDDLSAASADTLQWQADAVARTGPDGAFRFVNLGEGPYLLVAVAGSTFSRPKPVTAQGGEANVAIVLSRGGSATVLVRGPDGKPVQGAVVQALATDTRPDWRSEREGAAGRAFTDAVGSATVVGVAMGVPVRLTVKPPESRDDLLPTSIEPWDVKDVTVTLSRGYVVKGTVRDSTGKPVPDAEVEAYANGEWGSEATTGRDGTFKVKGLGPGKARLRARLSEVAAGEENADDSGGTEVTAGAENVVLVLDIGLTLMVRVVGEPGSDDSMDGELFRDGSAETSAVASTWGNGLFRFRGLASGCTYTFWAHEEGSETYVLGRGLAPGPSEIRLSPVRGKTLRVRVHAPAHLTEVRVSASMGPLSASGTLVEGELNEIRGLPDGTWEIQTYGKVGAVYYEGKGTCAAGGSIELDMKPWSEDSK